MRSLYTAATGMAAQQMRIDNIANNLSNVSTTGFKKARESFEDLVYQDLPIGSSSLQNQRPTSLQVGTGTRLVAMNRDFTKGDMTYTGNELDVAIGGRGFTPIINAPEVAILGVGRAAIQPVWDGEVFRPQTLLPLSLSYDHRVVNGGDGGRFLTELTSLLGDVKRMVM